MSFVVGAILGAGVVFAVLFATFRVSQPVYRRKEYEAQDHSHSAASGPSRDGHYSNSDTSTGE